MGSRRRLLAAGILVGLLTSTAALKVGFILVGTPQDFGWNFQHNKARLQLERHLFGTATTVVRLNVPEFGPNMCDFCGDMPGWNASRGNGGMWGNEPEYDAAHAAAVTIRDLIDNEGCGMIITTSFYYQWDTYHMAADPKYKDVYFVHASGWLTRPNMATIFPKIYQARYLSGIAMGYYVKNNNLTKRVGYVSSFPIGESVRAINAFKLGMEVADPEIELYLTWLYTWHNERKEALGVQRLIEFYGVEGIAQHTDSREPQITAASYGKKGVGYNADMIYTVGDSVLTTPILDWTNPYVALVQKALNKDPTFGQSLWIGADIGSWRLSEFSHWVPIEARLIIEQEQAKLVNGQDDIFCQQNLRDNKGRYRNKVGQPNPAVKPVPWETDHLQPAPRGTCLTENVVNQVCQEYVGSECVEHWVLEGVHETCEPTALNPGGIKSSGLPDGVCFLGGMNLTDECAAGEHLTKLGCAKAPKGSYAQNEKVIPCPVGYQAPKEGLERCEPCAAGNVAGTVGMDKCTPCGPGEYSDEASRATCRQCVPGRFTIASGTTTCDACERGKYFPSKGATACAACPDKTTTPEQASIGADACECVSGTYNKSSAGRCEGCPKGMTCAGAQTRPHLRPQYWASSGEPTEAFLCRTSRECPGGEVTENVCAHGRTGMACAQCEENYFLTYGDGKCAKCEDGYFIPMLLFVLAFFLSPVVMHNIFNSKSKKSFGNDAVLLGLVFGQLLAYSQIFAVLGTLGINWPNEISWALDVLRIFSFNLQLFMPACLFGKWEFELEFLFGTLLPAAFVLLYMAGFWATTLIKKLNQHVHTGIKTADLDVVFSTSGRAWMVFHVAILKQVTRVFECYEHPDGEKSILEFPYVVCFGARHNAMLPVAIILLITYCVWVFGYLCWVVQVAPKRFGEPRFFSRHNFLLLKFRPDRWYWCVPIFLRNTVLCFIVLAVPDYPLLQTMFFNLLMVFFLAITLAFMPWREPSNNTLEIALALILVVFTLAALPLVPYKQDLLGVLVFLMVSSLICEGCVIVRVVGQIAWNGWKQIQGKRTPETKPTTVQAQGGGQRQQNTAKSSETAEIKDLHSQTASSLLAAARHLSSEDLNGIIGLVSRLTAYDYRLVQAFIRLIQFECQGATPSNDPTKGRVKSLEASQSTSDSSDGDSSPHGASASAFHERDSSPERPKEKKREARAPQELQVIPLPGCT